VANRLYKEHLLIWTAKYEAMNDLWTPEIFIYWTLNSRYQSHRFKGPSQDNEIEALAIGRQLAEGWVDAKF
jgi:hypothetical protein